MANEFGFSKGYLAYLASIQHKDQTRILGKGLNGIINRVGTDITQASIRAMNGGTRGSMNLARILATGLQKNLGNPKELRQVHADVADAMRQSVKSSYEQTVKSRPGPYRMGQGRISGGALKRAVTDPKLAVGTIEGINYVDEYRLDREAAHWRRLNFGAEGTAVGGRDARRFPFRFDNVTLYTVGFPDEARPAFSMPPGLFEDAGGEKVSRSRGRTGQDRFIWIRGGANMSPLVRKTIDGPVPVTRGIKPRNFLDAGLVTLTDLLPGRYKTMVEGWLDDAAKSIKLPPPINVHAGLGYSNNKITQVNP